MALAYCCSAVGTSAMSAAERDAFGGVGGSEEVVAGPVGGVDLLSVCGLGGGGGGLGSCGFFVGVSCGLAVFVGSFGKMAAFFALDGPVRALFLQPARATMHRAERSSGGLK